MEIVWDAQVVLDLLLVESLVMNVRNAVPHVEIHVAERQNPFNVLDVALTVVRVVLAFLQDSVLVMILLLVVNHVDLIVGLNVLVIVETDVQPDVVLDAEAHVEIHAIQHALMVVVDVVRVVLEAAVQHVQHDVLMIVIMHALKHVLALAVAR